MSEWIQKLFEPLSDELDYCLRCHSQIIIQKSQEPFFVSESYRLQENKLVESTALPSKMAPRNHEISQEHTQEPNKQRHENLEGKRASKPPRRNEEMGLIAERFILEKKKYIKKKKPATPETQCVQYPTKNFLQNFKGAHLEYLQSKFQPSQLLSSQLYFRLKQKSGMSMEDYRQLYSVPEFQSVFREMFREKYLYRSMMLSRSGKESRKNHLVKLSVFEQSFEAKAFDRIN